MSVASLCNTTADVLSWTKVSDAYGGWTRTSDARYTAMPCRIHTIKGQEAMVYASQRVVATHKMFTTADYSAIDPEDHVVGADGARYRVQFVDDPCGMDHHVKAIMERLRGDVH